MEALHEPDATAFQTHHDHDAHRNIEDYADIRPRSVLHGDLTAVVEQSAASVEQSCQVQAVLRSHAMDQLALQFITSLNDRFGHLSREVSQVYDALFSFQRGEIPKKEALSRISDSIGDRFDLKYQLVELFRHEDARWGPEDFYIPLLSPAQPTPPFLQPAHQPKMRLPSMSNLWSNELPSNQIVATGRNESARKYHSVGGDDGDFMMEHGQWRKPSHAATTFGKKPDSIHFNPFFPLTPEGPGHTILTSSPFASKRPENLHQPNYDQVAPGQDHLLNNTWPESDCGNMWAIHGPDDLNHEQALVSKQVSPTTHDGGHGVDSSHPPNAHFKDVNYLQDGQDLASPELTQARDSEVSALDNPFTMNPPPNTIRAPARSRKRVRKASIAKTKIEHTQHDGEPEPVAGEDEREVSPTNIGEHGNSQTANGPFIHGLCGKGFAGRSKVKKHHWGGKIDNVNTTTGCWAKHGKPDAAWDDHPSCKGVLRDTPQATGPKRKSLPAEKKDPVVPAMRSSRFASLPSLPENVGNDSQDRKDATISRPEPTRFTGNDPALSQNNHVPTSSPFESLLTAVNIASKIEAPVAHGRVQSVVDQLDAQALAAERARQYVPTWTFSPHQQAGDFEHSQRFQPGQVAYGQEFSTSPMQTSMWMGPPQPQAESFDPYAISLVSPMQATGADPRFVPDPSMDPTAHFEYHACEPQEWDSPMASLSSEPETKRRRMY